MTEDKMQEALEIIQWFIDNDETNEGDFPVDILNGNTWNEVNAYWIDGLNRARKFVEENLGNDY